MESVHLLECSWQSHLRQLISVVFVHMALARNIFDLGCRSLESFRLRFGSRETHSDRPSEDVEFSSWAGREW
jgi:hypothetical protein